MPPLLPPDVIDYIFSFLQSDFVTLKKCCRAHPFLASFAEHHLFVDLALQNHPTYFLHRFLPSRLLNVFADKPYLPNVVQGLDIELLSLKNGRDMTESLEDIISILAIVGPRLKRLTLKGRGKGTVAWRNLDKAFQEAFLKSIRSPSVTEVSVQDISAFPFSNLFGDTTLKRLSLQGRFRLPAWPETLPSSHSIESLSLCDFRPFLHVLHCEPFKNLRTLDFQSATASDFHSLEKFLDPCSHTLFSLRVDWSQLIPRKL